MRPSMFTENDDILLIGEGNFSFSVAFSQLNPKLNITCTCYETTIHEEFTKKNIAYLKKNGIQLLLGIDGTKLNNYSSLKNKLYDKIIFNFPHVGGKMRIEKNRDLLRTFFVSCQNLLKANGEVLITLCNGQGGTIMDNPKRRWDDSWKVVEMAAHGNFLIQNIKPFCWIDYDKYIVNGYRGLEKQFHTNGALIHIFKQANKSDIENILKKDNAFDEMNIDNCCSLMSKLKLDLNSDHTYIYNPQFKFHLTLIINGDFNEQTFYDVLYENVTFIIESIKFIQSYICPLKLKISRTYEITYRSNKIPLYRERVISLHQGSISDLLETKLNIKIDR